MNHPELSLFLIFLGTACITGGIAILLRTREETRGAVWLSYTTTAVTGWICCDAAIVAVPDISLKFAILTLKYIFIVITPLAFFFFTLAYTGKDEEMQVWQRTVFMILPAISIGLLLTNAWTDIFYQQIPDPSLWVYNNYIGPYGPWFWVHLFYSYALILSSLVLLAGLLISSPQHFRRQIYLIILSVFIPFTANIISIFIIVGREKADLTPLFFALSGVLMSITIFWMGLFSIMPFARTRIITEIHEGVVVADGKGSIIDINGAACTATGMHEDEVVSFPADTFLSRAFGTSLSALQSAGTLTLHHTDAAGENHWSDLTASKVDGYDTRSGGTIILIRDVTERRRAEEEMRAKDLRLKIAMEGAGLTSWEWREGEGFVTYENPVFDHIIENVSTLRGLATELTTYLTEEAETGTSRMIEDILWGETDTFALEVPVGTPAEGHWIQITGRVIERNETGIPVWIVGITQDVSAHYAARAAVMEANTKIKLLTSITRHDVLNQVMVIRMLAELIEMEPADSMSPEVHRMVGQIDQATAMIEDQLSFTRDYEDLGSYAPSWQNVADVAAQASTVLSGTGIQNTCDTDSLEIYADPMFRKVMENLFENASRHGDRVTRMQVHFETASGKARLVVEDDGRGVRADRKELIFKQGYGQNTGFGLFLSREILALTQITITEEGIPGEGCRFVMQIPTGGYRGHHER